MNRKRALWISILAYISSFIIGIILAAILDVDLNETEVVPAKMWVAGIITAIIITALFSLWYFKDSSIKQSSKEGLYLGLTMIAVGFVLDMIIIVPFLIVAEASSDIIAYYLNPLFWLTVATILGTPAIIGMIKEKRATA